MRVVLQGSLQYFAAKELLAFIGNTHAGTFDAESGGDRVRLALREGHLVSAEGEGDAVAIVARLLSWGNGTFSFLDGIAMAEGVAPLEHELGAIVAEAEEMNAEARRVTDLFPDENVRFRVVNRPPGEINLTAEEFQVLFQIGSGKSLAQLLVDSGRPAADLYPIIKRLQMTGLIEPVADFDATDRKAARELDRQPAPLPAPASVPASEPAPEPEPVAAPPELELRPATPAGTGEAPELVATLTADDGTMHPLLEETSTIGRTPANTIALPDGSVSASHARVSRTAEGFVIEDLGSRNGTYINSEKLAEKRLLGDGDLVRLGKIILTFNLAAEVQHKQSTEREMIK